ITEMKKIAALAESHHVGFAPHNPNGPIATRVCQHLDAATPNFIIQEWLQTDVEWREPLIGGQIEIAEGCMASPKGSGLGVDINLEVLAEHPYPPRDMNLSSRPGVVPRKGG